MWQKYTLPCRIALPSREENPRRNKRHFLWLSIGIFGLKQGLHWLWRPSFQEHGPHLRWSGRFLIFVRFSSDCQSQRGGFWKAPHRKGVVKMKKYFWLKFETIYLFIQIKGRKRFSGFNHQEELQGLVHNPAFLQVGGDLDGYNGFYQHVSSLHALVYPNNTQVSQDILVRSLSLSKNTILPQSFF